MKSLFFYILSLESEGVESKINVIFSDDVIEQGLFDIIENEDNKLKAMFIKKKIHQGSYLYPKGI